MSPEADKGKPDLTAKLLTDSLLSHKSGTGGLRDVEEVQEEEDRSRLHTSEGRVEQATSKEEPSVVASNMDKDAKDSG